MRDKLTELARQGEWEKHKKSIGIRWSRWLTRRQWKDGEFQVHAFSDYLGGGMIPRNLGIEPQLWEAALAKAGSPGGMHPIPELGATIRELLKLWVNGDVDPWRDGD